MRSEPCTAEPALAHLQPEKTGKKERVHRAYNQGQLGFREVSLAREAKYHSQTFPDPRPLYMVAKSVPVQMRDTNEYTIGIIAPKPICAYKCNASTCKLETGEAKPDQLDVKCLFDRQSLLEKMNEQTERMRWDVYQSASSGHLSADASFTLPKLKPKSYTTTLLSHSELLTEGYQKEQIGCYCILQEELHSISEILENKHKLERALSIESLPIALYSDQEGTLTLFCEEELETSSGQLDASKTQLDEYAYSIGANQKSLRQLVTLMPLTTKLDFLNSFASYYTRSPNYPTISEMMRLVTDTDEHSTERVKSYFSNGIQMNQDFFHEGTPRSLIYILLDSYSKNKNRAVQIQQSLQYMLQQTDETNSGPSPTQNSLSREKLLQENEAIDTLLGRLNLLFDELVRCHVTPCLDELHWFVVRNGYVSEVFFDRVIAADPTTESASAVSTNDFEYMPEGFGKTVLQDSVYQNLSTEHLQDRLKQFLFDPVIGSTNYDIEGYRRELMVLFYYGANPLLFKNELIKTIEEVEKSYPDTLWKIRGGLKPSEWPDHIISLWENRKSDPLFTGWPTKLAEANAKISALKKELKQHPKPAINLTFDQKKQILPIINAYQQPPTMHSVSDDNETVCKVLQHYYRRPGPERIKKVLGLHELPDIWKPAHNCSHVLRARNNVLWYMALLEEYGFTQFNNDEKTLLALAAIYHDAAAEDVEKQYEESQSAFYFKRDMTSHFDVQLVSRIAQALERKEDDRRNVDETALDKQLRDYIRVLRFGDRMDYIRCSTVGFSFPDWSGEPQGFNLFDTGLLDLPLQSKAEFSNDPANQSRFQSALEACMHGAVDLASISGARLNDERAKGQYPLRYRLQPNDGQLGLSFEKTPHPVARMDQMIDDNVRRVIAEQAGITTCHAKEHRQCRADTRAGVYHGIHNGWYDLQQISVPACMSRVEKMQCDHNLSLLSSETRRQMQIEVTRLKKEGIAMNLGTLTQKTLASKEARQVLDRRGLAVVTEYRRRGTEQSGRPKYQKILTAVDKTEPNLQHKIEHPAAGNRTKTRCNCAIL